MRTIFRTVISPRTALIIMLALTSSFAMAEEFSFKFNFKGEVWNHMVKSTSKNAAFEVASQDCLNHFTKSTGNGKIKVDVDTADALIDTCANPR